MIKKLILVSILFILGSCGLLVERPKLEMTLAANAFMAAKDANASVLSPNNYRKAEFYYLKAKANYKKKYFNKAKQFALLSQHYAELAELSSQIKQMQEGNNSSSSVSKNGNEATSTQ